MKSVLMNIVDSEMKFSWRALNLITSAVRSSLACGSGMIISVPVRIYPYDDMILRTYVDESGGRSFDLE